MEEIAGKLWDRFVRRLADTRHGDAAVTLAEMSRTAGIMFRALGGEAGVAVKAAQATEHGAGRGLRARLAGTGRKIELAWRDHEALYLPAEIALFPERALNRDLYLWLAALAAAMPPGEWFTASQQATLRVLERAPAFAPRYRILVEAVIALRPDPDTLPREEAAIERALRAALVAPGSVAAFPAGRRPWQPLPLWLHPHPPRAGGAASAAKDPPAHSQSGNTRVQQDPRRRAAERVDMPDGKDGFMLFFRAESILSWAEYVRVDRPTEDDEGSDATAADDMARLSVARDGKATAARLRFDLDLPPADADDAPLGPGILLPEWHYKQRRLLPGHCRLQPLRATAAPPCGLPPRLAATARRIRRQFAALVPERVWWKRQFDGSELDLDACVEHATDRHLARPAPERGLYKALRRGQRDLACLVLADLSLSTDAHVSDEARVIDVIRDTLFLFSEALCVTGDPFALYGFSSLRRDNVRFHVLKDFGERYDDAVRARIAALKPGYYTRMGAAIRHATTVLARQHARQRLMLILTDGKPNDLDQYEGRYGIEDTRHAIMEARKQGLQPFCVTVDEKGSDYLSRLFGLGRYVVIGRPAELPKRLPLLYAQLTA